jgi:hypothetical protein
MISISFSISNPFSKNFKPLFFKHGSLTNNKRWEFEVHRTNRLIGFELTWTAMSDHAGLSINLSILTFEFYFQIYDRRHWNNIINDWCN